MSWVLAAVASGALLSMVRAAARRLATPRAWADAADALGFHWDHDDQRLRMRGELQGAYVRLTAPMPGAEQSGGTVRLVLVPERPLHVGAKLARGDRIRAPWELDEEIGDVAVDRPFFLEGPPDLLAAMLGVDARQVLDSLSFASSVVIEDGRIEIECRGKLRAERLQALVERAAELHQEVFWRSRNVPERLFLNARDDPNPAVRKTNLRALLTRHADSEHGERGAELALDSDDPRLRALGAAWLGERGLMTLGQTIRDARVAEADRLYALDLLMRGGGFSEELERCLRLCDGAVLSAVAERVSWTRDERMVSLLLERAPEVSGTTAVGFCRAFALLADARAEPHLLRWLEDADEEVQAEAAGALAHAGTTRAVEALLERTDGFMRSNQLKSAARHAVQMIQRRVLDADVGDVSLAEPAEGEGELSIVHASGDLALADGGER